MKAKAVVISYKNHPLFVAKVQDMDIMEIMNLRKEAEQLLKAQVNECITLKREVATLHEEVASIRKEIKFLKGE